MESIVRVALALSSFALVGAAAPQQFDLVCSGQLSQVGGATEPYSYHYRLDLTAKRWCDGECAVTKPIADVQPALITLEKSATDTPRRAEALEVTIDRTTGEHRIFSDSTMPLTGRMVLQWKGTCERQAFSGFPVPATTKF